jgi:hypothetical protein
MTYRKLWMAAAAAWFTVSVSAPPALAASSHSHPIAPAVISLVKVQIPQKHLVASNHKTDSDGAGATTPNTAKTDSSLANGAQGKQ